MKRETKECPYCSETILKTAKKCKHCWERLEEKSQEKERIKKEKDLNKKSAKTRFVNFLRFLLFIIVAFIFSYLALALVWLFLSLLWMLNPILLIVWIILFTWLFFSLRNILLWWFAYLINKIFKIPVNKKLARIFFRIIFILACIDQIVTVWLIETRTSTTFNVIYTLVIIFVCALFTVELKNICEIDEEL